MDERPKPGGEEIIRYTQEFLHQEYTQARERILGSELHPDDFQTLQDQLSLEEARQTLAFILGESKIPTLERSSPQRLVRDGGQGENLEKRFTRIQNFSLGFAKALGEANLLQDTPNNPQPLQRLEATIRNALFEDGIRAAYHAEQGGYDQTMLEIMKFYANHQDLPVPAAQDIKILKSLSEEYNQPNGWRILFREITGKPYIPFVYVHNNDRILPDTRDFFPAHLFIDGNISGSPRTALLKSDTIILGGDINGKDSRKRPNLGISATHLVTTASADCQTIWCYARNAYLEAGKITNTKILAEHATIGEEININNSQISALEFTNRGKEALNGLRQINTIEETREKVDFDIKFGNY
jgi:hypothetical protein